MGPTGSSGGERLVGLLELRTELRAALAAAHVPAHQRAGAALETLGDLGQLDADVVTGQQSCLGGLGQGHTRATRSDLTLGTVVSIASAICS